MFHTPILIKILYIKKSRNTVQLGRFLNTEVFQVTFSIQTRNKINKYCQMCRCVPLTRKLNSKRSCSAKIIIHPLKMDTIPTTSFVSWFGEKPHHWSPSIQLHSKSIQTDTNVIKQFYLAEDKKYNFILLKKPVSMGFFTSHHRLFLDQIHSQHQSYTGLVTLGYSCDLVLCGPASRRQILLFWHLKMFIWNNYCHLKHNSENRNKQTKKKKEHKKRISKSRH